MEASQDVPEEWQTQKTQEAGLEALLMARVAGIVREIDLDVAVRALQGTYDAETLREGILNPPHMGGTVLRQLLQQALPAFLSLEPDRKVFLKRTLLSQAINDRGEIEGFTASPYSIKQLPESVKWDLVEDSVSHTLWDREYRWVDAQGVHIDPVCNELVASLINRESDFVMQIIQSEAQMHKYVKNTLDDLKDKYDRETTRAASE